MNLEEVKRICVEKFLIPFEGTGPMTSDGRFMAYKDPGSINLKVTDEEGHIVPSPKAGLPITIAWGITFDELGNPIQLGEVWDKDKASRVKQIILNRFLAALLAMSPNLKYAPDEKVAAVLSFCYNLGLGNYRISTFRRKIQEEDWEAAQQECLKWNKAQGKVMRGLTLRRMAEGNSLVK